MLGLAVAVILMTAVTAGAAPERSAACAAPKPLPASLKRPPAGASATQLANFLLALPQRKPCDVNLFTSTFANGTAGFYPQGTPMQPVAGSPSMDAQVRAELVAFMEGSDAKTAALALYDRADVRTKVPLPTLRAALASLHGSVAEPVIAYFLSRPYVVRFGSLPGSFALAAITGQDPQVMTFNRRYEGEHFALWSGVFAHEVLHHDRGPASATEEVILNTLNNVVHMTVLARRPKLATSGTELSRQTNSWAVVLVNSRVPGSAKSAIIAPKGKGTLPGSAMSQPDLWSHGKDFHALGYPAKASDSSPAPPVFAALLRRILAPGVALPKPLTYSKKTAELFSKMNDTWLSPVDRLRVSVLLGLVSMEEIVKYTGLTRPKAITMFRLAPILAAMK